MNMDMVKQVVADLRGAKIEVDMCQQRLAGVLLDSPDLMGAIEAGIVKPCIPMDVIRRVERRMR